MAASQTPNPKPGLGRHRITKVNELALLVPAGGGGTALADHLRLSYHARRHPPRVRRLRQGVASSSLSCYNSRA